MSVTGSFRAGSIGVAHTYLRVDGRVTVGAAVSRFLTYFLLCNTFIPISLYVLCLPLVFRSVSLTHFTLDQLCDSQAGSSVSGGVHPA